MRHRGTNWVFAAALGCALAALLAGCIFPRQPSWPTVEYAFAPGVPENPNPANGRILAVRLFEASPAFERSQFSYRVSELGWETDYYNLFEQPPATLLTYLTRKWLDRSGIFQSVAIPGLAPGGAWLLQGYLNEIYADFRGPGSPAAVVSVRYTFYPPDAGRGAPPLFNKTYRAAEPFGRRTPQALMDAWDAGLEKILRELTADVRRAVGSYKPPAAAPSPAPVSAGADEPTEAPSSAPDGEPNEPNSPR